MRKLTAGLMVLGGLLLSTPAVAAPPPAMTGSWAGTDTDGSALSMSIGGGPNRMNYQDAGATVCLNTFGEFSKASGGGFAEIVGNAITLTTDIDCHLSTGRTTWMSDFVLTFDYDPGTDTITDQFGVCWHRPNRSDDCA